MRKSLGEPPAVVCRSATTITSECTMRLITPLFGGGVKPAQADPVTVVRATEVRGHLRFWWRACRGARYQTVAELKQAEDLLWGAASSKDYHRPAQVQVAVQPINREQIQPDQPFEVRPGNPDRNGNPKPKIVSRRGSAAPAYAAFPLQPEQDKAVVGMTTAAVQVGVVFRLTLVFPAAWDSEEAKRHFAGTPEQEVAAALWAWQTFGGIGARTRRGFGALQQIDPPTDAPTRADDAVRWLRQKLGQHVAAGAWRLHQNGLPHLVADAGVYYKLESGPTEQEPANLKLAVLGFWQDPISAWHYLIDSLREFRQARPAGVGHPGRSRWPEPERIRQLTSTRTALHGPIPTSGKFPRGRFGLPIVFHFKDRSDPQDTTLEGANNDRLNSPLILRPLPCANGQVVGLALLLAVPALPPGGFALKQKGRATPWPVDADLDTAEAAQIKTADGSAQLLGSDSDPLIAFLHFL